MIEKLLNNAIDAYREKQLTFKMQKKISPELLKKFNIRGGNNIILFNGEKIVDTKSETTFRYSIDKDGLEYYFFINYFIRHGDVSAVKYEIKVRVGN